MTHHQGTVRHALKDISRIDYVVLLCGDFAAMKRFYSRIIGFPLHRDWGDWVEYRVGENLLALRPRGRSYDGPPIAGGAGVQLAFRVGPDQVQACHDELIGAGATILEGVAEKESGHRTFFFRDPDGNILEIYAELFEPDRSSIAASPAEPAH